ncbi:MAG: hypothetical protein ACK5MQ_10985, partial [Pikeienuella sp.]
MRSVAPRIVSVIAALALASPLSAQEAATAAADDAPADPNETIATVNGENVTLGELIALRAELPPQYQTIPDQALYDGLLEQIANQILLRQAAEQAGLPERPAVMRGLAFQRTSFLAELYVRERLNEAITEETLAAA